MWTQKGSHRASVKAYTAAQLVKHVYTDLEAQNFLVLPSNKYGQNRQRPLNIDTRVNWSFISGRRKQALRRPGRTHPINMQRSSYNCDFHVCILPSYPRKTSANKTPWRVCMCLWKDVMCSWRKEHREALERRRGCFARRQWTAASLRSIIYWVPLRSTDGTGI